MLPINPPPQPTGTGSALRMSFGLMKSSLSPIAVDFGTAAMKVLQVTTEGRPALLAAACLETPDHLIDKDAARLAFQAEQLPELIRQAGFKGRRVACTVSAARTFVQHVQVQKSDDASMRDLVMEQLRQVSSIDPEQLILRHVEVGEVIRSGNRCVEVICIAIPRDVVGAYMGLLRKHKLDAVGIHSEHLADVSTFDLITRRQNDSELTSLYVDLGYGTTKVMVTHGRALTLAKTIHLGGRNLDSLAVRQHGGTLLDARSKRCGELVGAPAGGGGSAKLTSLHTTDVSAEHAPRSGLLRGLRGLMPGREPPPDRRCGAMPPGATAVAEAPSRPSETLHESTEGLEALTDEITLAVRYHQALFPDRRIGRTVFIGGEARSVETCRAIARSLRVASHVADPLAMIAKTGKEPCVNVDLSSPQPGWATVLGLCFCPTDL